VGASYDKSRNDHIVRLLRVVIHPPSHNDESHWNAIDLNLFILLFEDTVECNIRMRDPNYPREQSGPPTFILEGNARGRGPRQAPKTHAHTSRYRCSRLMPSCRPLSSCPPGFCLGQQFHFESSLTSQHDPSTFAFSYPPSRLFETERNRNA
jgi:hypothetical protein